MRRSKRLCISLLLVSLLATSGCHPTQPFYLGGRGDLSSYLDTATEVSYPDVEQAALDEVSQSHAPLTLSNPEFKEFWDLTLEEVVAISVQNSKLIRGGQPPSLQGSEVVSAGNDFLIASSRTGSGFRFQTTIYDPAIRESEAGFLRTPGQLTPSGQLQSQNTLENGGGVESALSEFDAQLSSSLFWNSTDRPQNIKQNLAAFNPFFVPVLQSSTAAFRAEVAKKTASGTEFFFRNTVDYDSSNLPSRNVISAYTAAFEAEVRQPLLRGRGTQINRMPIVIARIGTDQQIADLENQIQNMVCNIEVRYWDLQCAYRRLETAKQGRDSALTTWRKVYAERQGGTSSTQEEAQAREQYFFFRSQVEQALNDLYSKENDLRWLMGLASTDGRLIRPIDVPTEAKVEFDWCSIQAEALVRRPLLRSERWEIKKKDLELVYARNGLLPSFNAVALYRWLGVGDGLVASQPNGLRFPQQGSHAYEGLTTGDFQEVRFGAEFAMPVGFRQELANVRNAQLKIAREKAVLEDMELDTMRELTHVVRAVDANYQLAQTHFNRVIAAEEEVESFETLRRFGKVTLDLVLDAQRRRADAEIAYYRALCEFNKAIALLHLRKGSILEYSGIQLGEGPWPQKAYWDALGQARRRDASYQMDYGWSRPKVISRGPAPQHFGPGDESNVYPSEQQHGEAIPTPVPTPAKRPATGAELPAPPTAATEPVDVTTLFAGTKPAAAPARLSASATTAATPIRMTISDVPNAAPQAIPAAASANPIRAVTALTETDDARPPVAKAEAVFRQLGHEQPNAPRAATSSLRPAAPAASGWQTSGR